MIPHPSYKLKIPHPSYKLKIPHPSYKLKMACPSYKLKMACPSYKLKIPHPSYKLRMACPSYKLKMACPSYKLKMACPSYKLKIPHPSYKLKMACPSYKLKIPHPSYKLKMACPSYKLKMSCPSLLYIHLTSHLCHKDTMLLIVSVVLETLYNYINSPVTLLRTPCSSPHLVGSSTADESRAYEERDFEINVEQTQYDAEDFAVLTKLNFIIFWKLLIDKKKKVSLCV